MANRLWCRFFSMESRRSYALAAVTSVGLISCSVCCVWAFMDMGLGFQLMCIVSWWSGNEAMLKCRWGSWSFHVDVVFHWLLKEL